MEIQSILTIAISFKYILIRIGSFNLINLGSLNILTDLHKFVYFDIARKSHPTSKLPHVSLIILDKTFSIGKSIHWEPEIKSQVLEVIDYADIRTYNKNDVKFNYYPGIETTIFKEPYNLKNNYIKTKKVWIHDGDESLMKFANEVKCFPMYNRKGKFQYPDEIVILFKDMYESFKGMKSNNV